MTSDWEFIVADMTVGVVASGLGWLASRRAVQDNKNMSRSIPIVCAVLGFVFAGQMVNPLIRTWKVRRDLHAAGLAIYGNETAADLHTQVVAPIIERLRSHKRLAAFDSLGRTGATQLTAVGMARLDRMDLEAHFAVRQALAIISPTLCAGFWTGQFPTGELQRGLGQLNLDQQRIWITVSARALSLEVDADVPPRRISGSTADRALDALQASLTPEGRAAFAEADQTGARQESVACRAFHAFVDGMKGLPASERDIALRSLDNPKLVDR